MKFKILIKIKKTNFSKLLNLVQKIQVIKSKFLQPVLWQLAFKKKSIF